MTACVSLETHLFVGILSGALITFSFFNKCKAFSILSLLGLLEGNVLLKCKGLINNYHNKYQHQFPPLFVTSMIF